MIKAKNAVQPEEVYCNVDNDYANTSASTNYDSPKCDPAASPDNENYAYDQREQPDEDEAPFYEIPPFITSK